MAKSKKRVLNGRLLTARSDAPDFRDYIYRPALVNIAPEIAVPTGLKIRDQGNEGACTGFGLAAVIDRLMVEAKGETDKKSTQVSTRMLYEMARRYDEWDGEDYDGSSCRGAIKGWYNMGVCRESLYPYGAKKPAQFTIAAAKDARNNTAGAYYRLGSRISDYHAALQEVGSIYCSSQVHGGWTKPPKNNPVIAFDAENPPSNDGGHAFAIVGYNDKGFWIQNSWGRSWGKNGVALWTYEDWHINITDAWVFRLALPTPQIWHLPARGSTNANAIEGAPKPTRAEIAGHFVHIDDGQFHGDGRYWSDLNDVQQTANLVADSDKYDHLLFYAHGGLNSPHASARRVAAMKEVFKSNRVYAYHWMYDTGLLEELKDIILGRRQKAEQRAGGFTDWLDKIVEKAARVPGRAMWREMKAGASAPFSEAGAGSDVLNAFMNAFKNSGKPKIIHLAGHSTGMILLCYLLERLQKIDPALEIKTVSLMAPAGSVDLFTDKMQPLLKQTQGNFRISRMNLYNLSDEIEQDDNVAKIYNKSLLYLVSRSFEETVPERILGMEKHSQAVARRSGLSRLQVYYADGDAGTRTTTSTTHGGFDNDLRTMNHILENIVGKKPTRKFVAKDLDY